MTHKLVILDEIFDQLEAAKSGIVPGSVEQAIVSGVQNNPSQIRQNKVGGTSGSNYTVFPLTPIKKNCCIDKSYLNFEFDLKFNITATFTTAPTAGSAASKVQSYHIPFFIGFRDTPSMFNLIQIMCENTTIWQTVYQREEATLAYNSLPETEIRGNNQYSSIDKMKNHLYSPMKHVIFTFDQANGASTTTFNQDITVHFKATVDLNRLTPALSNLHFTTPHMGNLRLKVFIQEIEKALFFCPDYSFYYPSPVSSVSAAKNINYALERNSVNVQYWQFYPLSEFFGSSIAKTKIPFLCYGREDLSKAGHEVQNLYLVNPETITFSNPTSGDFMSFASGLAEIVQTCFDIKDEEYNRLNDHFASMGSVIIPVNVWDSSVFNNSEVPTKNTVNTSMIGSVGGYNIDFISVWFHGNKNPCALTKEFLTNFQLLLDGRPINAIPYDYINDKCIVDMTQAIIDTDHEEINKDYISSLSFLNLTDDRFYIDKPLQAYYGNGILHYDASEDNSSIGLMCGELRNPNCFSLNFSTNLPDAFHSGACILENSPKQGTLRFISTTATGTNLRDETARGKFPFYLDSYNQDLGTTCGFSCFCDACIVLTYDAARGTCYDGQLSWAAPYA